MKLSSMLGRGRKTQSAPSAQPEKGPARAAGSSAPELFKADPLGSTCVITIVDPALTPPKVADLQHELMALLGAQTALKNLVIDMQNVEYLDSACLYMLVQLLNKVTETNGRIAVVSARHAVEGIFKLTRLDQLFPIKRTVLDAVAAVER
jgi:anti-anti-sigma factor